MKEALKPALGPRTIAHFRIRWSLSTVNGLPVPHCDPCFLQTGHLYQMDVQHDAGGKMFILCTVCKLQAHRPPADAYQKASMEALSKLKD